MLSENCEETCVCGSKGWKCTEQKTCGPNANCKVNDAGVRGCYCDRGYVKEDGVCKALG